MNPDSLQLIALGLVAASANVLGGIILFPSGIYTKYKSLLKYVLALGAGFMLAVTFIEILPNVFELWSREKNSSETFIFPMVLVLAGYLLTQFFEHTIAPHVHLGEEVHHCDEHIISATSAYTAIGGLLMHTFFDGVSIAAASQLNFKVGFLVFISIFLHKFPEGFTVASLILASGKGFKEVLIATSVVGLTTLIGVLVYVFVGANVGFSISYALPVASGVMIYVAASDLIPEVNHHGGKRPIISLFVFAGVALFFALHFLLHTALES
jgi:zinc transporter ZupT